MDDQRPHPVSPPEEAEEAYRRALQWRDAGDVVKERAELELAAGQGHFRATLDLADGYLSYRLGALDHPAGGEYEHKASVLYEQARQLAPDSADPYLGLGRIAAAQRRLQDAASLLGEARDRAPGRGDIEALLLKIEGELADQQRAAGRASAREARAAQRRSQAQRDWALKVGLPLALVIAAILWATFSA